MLPSVTNRMARPISLTPDANYVGLEDIPSVVFPRFGSQGLFTFSPFGLCCRQCEKQIPIKLDERSIRNHLKKHCMDSRMSVVRSILLGFSKQVEIAKKAGTIDPYRHDDTTYVGFLCVCGQSFPRKDNAIRHCKTIGCDDSGLQKINLIKLCCGRYVTQSQVCSFFNEAPRITQQFNYREARAALLP